MSVARLSTNSAAVPVAIKPDVGGPKARVAAQREPVAKGASMAALIDRAVNEVRCIITDLRPLIIRVCGWRRIGAPRNLGRPRACASALPVASTWATDPAALIAAIRKVAQGDMLVRNTVAETPDAATVAASAHDGLWRPDKVKDAPHTPPEFPASAGRVPGTVIPVRKAYSKIRFFTHRVRGGQSVPGTLELKNDVR